MAALALTAFLAHPASAGTPAIADARQIEFERALCSGLAMEIERASSMETDRADDAQHVDRRAVPLELRVRGSDAAKRQSRTACLLGALDRAGFAARIAEDDPNPRDMLAITIDVPNGPFADAVRVKFNVSRCVPGSSFWAHPGYVDFQQHDRAWSNTEAKITEFLDGWCPKRP